MLTKSDYLRYLQCPKSSWLYKNRKDLRPKITEVDQAKFDQGYEVEEYAKKLFPRGTNVIGYADTGKGETVECVRNGCKTIFQATAQPPDLLARADILNLNTENNKWDIYEVKSSTEVKEEHLPDLAFQRIAFEKDGFEIGRTYLIHINKEYVRDGEIDIQQLFTIEDLTEEVNNIKQLVSADIPVVLAYLRAKDEPDHDTKGLCLKPKDCMFKDYCWNNLPAYSIYNIQRINGRKLMDLKDMGILKITDVPDDFPLSEFQQNQVMVAKSGKPMIDIAEIHSVLGQLEYPLYFFDYETYSQAVPLFDGTKPYQNICFQYSLHVLESQESDLQHFEFLHAEATNPMEKLLSSLRQHIGNTGSVIVWNKSFEMKRNEEMAEQYPEYSDFLMSINSRVYDLMEVFSRQYYVHPDFKGSYSIKKVLPVLVPHLSHADLEDIQDGGTASLHWFKHIFCNSADKSKTVTNLLKYCELDTLAEVEIWRELQKI